MQNSYSLHSHCCCLHRFFLPMSLVCLFVLNTGVAQGQQVNAVVQSKGSQADAARGRKQGSQGAKPGQNAATSDSAKVESQGGDQQEKNKEGSEQSDDKQPSDVVKRPHKPPRVPDPREFDAQLDDTQRVQFNFHGQSWPDVLQWLASLGNWSLDWQELPNDYINLKANRPYEVVEIRDLLNRLLFDRGYTMVLRRDVLLVSKIDKLDPSLLPRIEDQSQLLDLPAHDFVKTTFALPPELKADQAAGDIKPLLSKHAKIQPLMATNRLLVIDLVVNLRDVSSLVNKEHAAATGHTVPKEFPIRFARADYVADQVMILLGLDPATRRSPQELQVEQQKLQLFMQMQQRGNDVSKYLRKGETSEVNITVNPRNNSVVVNAPEKELVIIKRAIEMLDVPTGQLDGAIATELSMEKYQLATLSPEAIVTALEEIADLDPRTRFKLDTEAKIVFASATSRDHAKIKEMIGQLDGSGRELEVIWLRRLPADAVAQTVLNLMVGKQDDQEDSNNRYSYYGYRGRSRDTQEPSNKGFRVDADIENNRLLLWANEEELKEVESFLEKLGEIPGQSGNPNTVRVLDSRSDDDTQKLLQRLRQIWPNTGENELRIEDTLDNQPSEQVPSEQEPATAADPESKNAATSKPFQSHLISAPLNESETGAPKSPPITITINRDGRLILSSSDTRALDRLEDLIAQIAPPARDYEVFYLKYALASLVTLNLEEYFEEEDASDNSQDDYYRGWYGFDRSESKQESPTGLSRRRPIRFIYDYDTNSVLVSHATTDQLEIVRDLIEVYDKPPSEDSISARRFQLFKLEFAQAEAVASTIKEVYRDLLSSKDQVFQKQGGEKEQSSQATNFVRLYGGPSDEDKKPTKVKASFAGALSVGVDPVSNTIIVSAQEEWMSSVSDMIEYLDREAKPYRPSVQVLNTNMNAQRLHAALLKAVGPSQKPVQQPGAQQPGQNQPGEQAGGMIPGANRRRE